jgi:ElaB/YqjD/DUF883 family membrane-anchored ribosome-binding protein
MTTTDSLSPDSTAIAFDESQPPRVERSSSSSATVDRIASGAHQAVDRIAAAANSAAEQLSIGEGNLAAAKDRWMQACGAYVKENPLTSLGIAVGIGFLLSRLTR